MRKIVVEESSRWSENRINPVGKKTAQNAPTNGEVQV
jgi:hypothetical protein